LKDRLARDTHPQVEHVLTRRLPRPTTLPQEDSAVEELYAEHAEFVWRSLQHLGVRSADLEDLLQEVFIVVHRKLPDFDGRSRVTTWLFGICLRVAARQRRRAWFRFERQGVEVPERAEERTPEDQLGEEQRSRVFERALGHLSLEQRAVFVLFEFEGKSCQDIAELVGAPLGTVYSRLHHARRDLRKSLLKAGFPLPGDEP
jgi:RNA polymerase sigma-70 factor (ECF subfamily)